MEKKYLIIGIVILAIISVGAFIILRTPAEQKLNLKFGEYVFSESELNFGVMGSPPRETGDCKVRGIITDIKFVEAYNDSCIDFNTCIRHQNNASFNQSNCCPSDYSPIHPTMYIMRIYVQEIKSLSEGDYEETCEALVPTGEYHNFKILKDKITEIPKNGLTIDGVIKNSIDIRRFDSYILDKLNY